MRIKPSIKVIILLYTTIFFLNPVLIYAQNKVPLPQVKKNIKIQAIDSPHWDNGIDCGSCHIAHQSPGAQLTDQDGNANLCMSCHNPTGLASSLPFSNSNRANPGSSGNSHAWEVSATNNSHGANPPSNSEMALRIYDGEIVCSTCHDQHKQTFPPFLRTTNYRDALCKDCHSVRDVGSYRTNSNNKGSHPVGISFPTSDSRFYSSPQNSNLPLIDPDRVECSTCHSPHYANSGDGYILNASNNNNLCQSCHLYDEHVGQGCRKCHDPHDPYRINLLLVNRSVSTPNSGNKSVVFTSETGTNSFADGNSTYDGICEVCHTSTSYHRNNSSGNHQHESGEDCTHCHPHDNNFRAKSCDECHDQPQDNGDGIPSGGRRAILAEFGETSHHLHSSSLNVDDCRVCHDMSQHMQGKVRLINPDNSNEIYVLNNSPMQSESEASKLVPFCKNCHDGDANAPFSDGKIPPAINSSLWNSSAHKIGGSSNMPLSCIGDGDNFGCHATGHGSSNVKMLNDEGSSSLETFCYNCHTNGRITNNALSGSGLADDIQQAFSMGEKHNLGTNFTINGKNFILQCTTCHNPHVVTGKHWDITNNVSPITKPDLNANPSDNPRALGNSLWGVASGQKMADFAASGSGTGGWKFNMNRGIPFGSTNIPSDQGGYYQPPKTASGYNFEFDGSILPDYPSFCLECHTHRVSSNNPPVNYGQGISCTGNSVDPPNQRIECGAQHGLGTANVPKYSSDPGWWGSNGNPDPIFQQDGATRGRGYGHFMRWPYESADRNAGINFVMSCTDCHEAHGSNGASMLRSTVNAYGPGTSNWNTMCNNCHYYYGGQHAGMSCANASCHEANSIHRIIHNTASYSKYLWTPPGVPEITEVDGASGSNLLTVTFSEAVYANSNQSGSLSASDFKLTDTDNGRTITNVSHTTGASTAELTLSSAIDASNDIGTDQLAAKSLSIFDNLGIPMQTSSITITGTVCPEGTVSWQLNEAAGSATVTDDSGILVGTVGNPSFAMQGDGYFHGDENQGTFIDFNNSAACLLSPRALTIEMRVKPTAVDLDWEDANGDGIDDIPDRNATFNRIFERKRNIKVTIMHAWYSGDTTAARNDRARVQVKYFVDSASRHTCPNPQWPDDPYEGNDSRWHQINSNIDVWPIVNNHWYKIKVVFDSDKPDGPPVDIYMDDQGPNGNDVGENWSGYVNASMTINESSSCKWGALTGDFIASEDQISYIGTPPNHNSVILFKGLIDWITWKPVVE